MNKNYNLDEVIYLDHTLQRLAAYDICKGMIVVPNTEESSIDLANKIINKFNYFKRLVQSGECTIEFIQNDVLSKYGPFYNKKENCLSTDEYISNKKENDDSPLDKNLVMKLLKEVDPYLTEKEANAIINSENTNKKKKKK